MKTKEEVLNQIKYFEKQKLINEDRKEYYKKLRDDEKFNMYSEYIKTNETIIRHLKWVIEE